MSGALTRKDLAGRINERMGFSVRGSRKVVDALLEIMKESLGDGKKIKIVRFGSLVPVEKRARRGVNPADGTSITIASRRTVVFRPSKVLKGMVNAGGGEEILPDRGGE